MLCYSEEIRGSNDAAGKGKTLPGHRLPGEQRAGSLPRDLRDDRRDVLPARLANFAARHRQGAPRRSGSAVQRGESWLQGSAFGQCNLVGNRCADVIRRVGGSGKFLKTGS